MSLAMSEKSAQSFEEYHDVHEFLEEDGMTDIRRNQIFEDNGITEGLPLNELLKQMDKFFFGDESEESEEEKEEKKDEKSI